MKQSKLQSKRTQKSAKRKKKKKVLKKKKVEEVRAIAKSRGSGFFRINKYIARILFEQRQKGGMSHSNKAPSSGDEESSSEDGGKKDV